MMSTVLALPNGQILFTFLLIGGLGLLLSSVGALLRIWTWKTPQSIGLLLVGVILFFFVFSFAIGEMSFG
ncbi:MAG: hypothetical protein JSW55_11320 [Chloroflexota bacterium]|nr:MAG: hypothetical protein JSW55_11320 [Chloroflexota bacterium]